MVMFIKFTLSLLFAPFSLALSLPARTHAAPSRNPFAELLGRKVCIPTEAYGDQMGMILRLVRNPVYGLRGMLAYVVSLPGQPVWNEWIPLTELPEETCCDCGVHFYTWQLCPICGSCGMDCNCSSCTPEPAEGEEDCLWFLRDPDSAYDEYRENGGKL